MTSKRVEEAIKDKSPITRGSDSHERTFNIKAVEQEDGINAKIIDILVKKWYSPIHYNLQWSTGSNRSVPFRGDRYETKKKAREVASNRQRPYMDATVVPSHRIAVVFKTLNGDEYHFKKSVNFSRPKRGELLYKLLVERNPENISDQNAIEVSYKPTSNTGGKLRMMSENGAINMSGKTHDGTPDTEYTDDEDLILETSSWVEYKSRVHDLEKDWVECPIVKAFEGNDGKEIVIIVESPLGDAVAFRFELTPDDSSPYWKLINGVASGDPANLEDSESKVYLRHRVRSFHEFDPEEHQKITKKQFNDILSTDVDGEWELRATDPYSNTSRHLDEDSEGLIQRILNIAVRSK